MTDATARWTVQRFDELSREQLYAIIAAREEVFVVEQDCPYQDVDGEDIHGLHVTGWARDADHGVLAYARVLAPGRRFAEPSIGRVLTTAAGRGCGLGRELMHRAIAVCEAFWPDRAIRISAQQYLQRFYEELGFATIRGPYPEDGIPHLEMLRSQQRQR